jgi:hypothetical protein
MLADMKVWPNRTNPMTAMADALERARTTSTLPRQQIAPKNIVSLRALSTPTRAAIRRAAAHPPAMLPMSPIR